MDQDITCTLYNKVQMIQSFHHKLATSGPHILLNVLQYNIHIKKWVAVSRVNSEC